MIPDEFLLHLHSHAHTEHTLHDHHQAELAQKHSHCPVEDVFGAPYHGTATLVEFTPINYQAVYSWCYTSIWHNSTALLSRLRGPPVV